MLAKYKLEIIVFCAGAVVMILELLGSRIFAPFLGNSIYVWTSLIGLILGALSFGYYLGGRLSQKNPNLKFLGIVLFWVSLLIAAIALLKTLVLSLATAFGVLFGSLLAALILFVPPSILLGIVSPYAVRLRSERLDQVGQVAGNLYAISTIGSIVGTFAAGFLLIPSLPTTELIFGLSLVTLLLSFFSWHSGKQVVMMLLLIVAIVASGFIPSAYVFEDESLYNHIRVIDVPTDNGATTLRVLSLATEVHSVIDKNSDDLVAVYHNIYHLDSLFQPEIKSALTLGGGAYVAPKDFLKRYPQATMTVVERDPAVTAAAEEYFDLEADERLKIVHQDARLFLNDNQEKFDAIYVDVYSSYFSVPFHLATQEALELMSQALNDDGVIVFNFISSIEGKSSLYFQAAHQTISSIFPQIYIFPAHSDFEKLDQLNNIVIFATKKNQPLDLAELKLQATPEQQQLLERHYQYQGNFDVPILTDDFAPVDYYISKLLSLSN